MTITVHNLLKDDSVSNYWRGRFEILGKDRNATGYGYGICLWVVFITIWFKAKEIQ